MELTDEQKQQLQERLDKVERKEKPTEAARFFAELQGTTASTRKDREKEGELFMTDEQFERFMKKDKEERSKETEKMVENTQKRYNIPKGEAQNRVQHTLESVGKRQEKRNSREYLKRGAEALCAYVNFKRGNISSEELYEAYAREGEVLGEQTRALQTMETRGIQNINTRALSEGTANKGGNLVPEIFRREVYEVRAQHGRARRFGTIIPMETDTLNIPTVTGDVSVNEISEAGQITASDMTFGQKTLNPKKFAAITVMSREVVDDADPAIIPIVRRSMGRQLAGQEDDNVFVGSSSNITGILENTTSVVRLGGSSTSGATDYTDISIDDLINLSDAPAEEFLDFDDVAYWGHKTVLAEISKLRGNDSFFFDTPRNGQPAMINGWPFQTVPKMPSSTSAGDKFMAFGSLENVAMGEKGDVEIDLLTEGTVNSNNLGETYQVALRAVERWDNVMLDENALPVLQTADS